MKQFKNPNRPLCTLLLHILILFTYHFWQAHLRDENRAIFHASSLHAPRKKEINLCDCPVPLCKDPCCSAPVLGTKIVNVFQLKISSPKKVALLPPKNLHSSSC